jgi:hypothetical protein
MNYDEIDVEKEVKAVEDAIERGDYRHATKAVYQKTGTSNRYTLKTLAKKMKLDSCASMAQ